MLSSTVSRDSALVSWKVRTMPARAIWWARFPCNGCPLNVHSPLCGRSNPVNKLNRVVLPAPLGPMMAVMLPRWISRWSTFTATSPPNRRITLSTTRIGSGLATPGSAATSANAARARSRPGRSVVVSSSSDMERDLPPITEDPLWPENQQCDDPGAEQDEHQRVDLVGGEDGGRQ